MTARSFLLAALLLAGCAAPVSTPATTGTVTATGTLAVSNGSLRQVLDAPELQPWKKADIGLVKLTLYKADGHQLLSTVSLKAGELDRTVSFASLSMNTAYEVEARAWADASGTVAIDDAVASSASCLTGFATTTVEQVNIGRLKLRLKDKTFNGKGTTGLEVTDGQVNDTTATPGIELVETNG